MWPFKKKKTYKIEYQSSVRSWYNYENKYTLQKGYDPADAWRRFVGPNHYSYTLINIEEYKND